MIRLTDGHWERIRNHFPEENIADGRPGRKPVSTRRVLEAVLWILNTGAQWHMLPQSYPNYKTVHRRFQTWSRDEVLRRLLTDVANELRDQGSTDAELRSRFCPLSIRRKLHRPRAASGVAVERPRGALHDMLRDHHLLDTVEARQVEHGVKE